MLATTGVIAIAPAVASADESAYDIEDIGDIQEIQEVSLESLLDSPVDIATVKPQTQRETAGIVTVITREEILNSGARDIIDVLRLVPGFSFGVDVQGTVDVGVRGNWGHEGKTLLLIDGQEMNELLYSTNALGNHYPVDQIQRVEIIRGPGSAIYGGYAELAVINVITRGGDELGGVAVAGTYGQMERGFGHRTVSLSYGERYNSGLTLSLSGFFGQGNRSDTDYTDFNGTSYSSVDNAAENPAFVNLALGYKGLKLRFIYDDFTFGGQDGYGTVEPRPVDAHFKSLIADAHYEKKVGEKLTVTPRLNFRHQTPWNYDDDPESTVFFDVSVMRLLGNVMASYDAVPGLNLLAGVEGYYDYAKLNDLRLVGSQTMFGTEPDVAYQNVAGITQALYNTPIANFTAGARYEYHSQFGGSFVPRAAITKVMGRFHSKLLASQAFRAPGIENINVNADIKPEKTTVFEGELGYQLGYHQFVSLNAYDITIKRPIIYSYDPASMSEIYQNFDQTGTRGVEAEYRLRYKWGYATANWSYYNAAGKNKIALYQVPTDDSVHLAFPAHKVAVTGSVNLTRSLTFNPSAIFTSERFGYMSGDADGNPVLGSRPGGVMLNANLLHRDLFMKGLDAGLGCFNILGKEVLYLQPYDGGHAPLPGPSREFVLKLSYTYPFK
jgi:outer membrane cobalamin receptor